MFKATSNEYLSNGLIIEPANPHANDRVNIVYNGMLAQKGATQLYARVGYGSNWQNTQEYAMYRTSCGYETAVNAANAETLNVAFRDAVNNWDNNHGLNYNFNVQR
jgi:hypothetical protein